MIRVLLVAALALAVLGGAVTPAAADGFTIVLTPTVQGATTVSGAVRNVPPGTQTVKLELRLKNGNVLTQTIDQYSNGNFVFKDVKFGDWVSLRATAQGGVAELTTEVGPEAASMSNGYGDGNYQGYQGPYYFPGYLGVNGSGYAYPGNYGYPSWGPQGNAATYFYPGSYSYGYAYPGIYYYPGYAGYGGTAYPGTYGSGSYYGYPGWGGLPYYGSYPPPGGSGALPYWGNPAWSYPMYP